MHRCAWCSYWSSNDVCPGKGTVLVTVAGTYQIFVLGSETAQNIFVPCDPLSKTPQTVSCTKFISEDLVIGAGVGQLVLWNAELGNRLQNLVFCNQGEVLFHHCTTSYNACSRYLSPLWYQCRRSKLYLVCLFDWYIDSQPTKARKILAGLSLSMRFQIDTHTR